MTANAIVTQGTSTLFRFTAEVKQQQQNNADSDAVAQLQKPPQNAYSVSLQLLADIQSRTGDFLNDAVKSAANNSSNNAAAAAATARRTRELGEEESEDEDE